MNILYICDEYPPGRHGGIGTSVQLLAREMVRLRHNVVVAGFYDWGYGGKDEFEDQGVKVYRFRRIFAAPFLGGLDKLPVRAIYKALDKSGLFEWDIRKSMVKYTAFLRDLIRQHNIDIAEIPDWLDYMRFCRRPVLFPRLPVPTLIKLNGSRTYFLREAGEQVPSYVWEADHDLLVNATAVAGVSKYTADKTATYLADARPMKVLHNGIALPQLKISGTRKERTAVFTGSLLKKKGIFQLAKAWNLVNEHYPDAQLLVFGKGQTEDIKALLSSKAVDTVQFRQHVPREILFQHLAEASMAIFPSYAECFALAPMEAMACGTAVIYSWRTSGPELIDNNLNGILIDPDNINEIAEKIMYLFSNPDVRDRLAAEGKEHVMDKFGINIIAQQNLECYTELIEKYKAERC